MALTKIEFRKKYEILGERKLSELLTDIDNIVNEAVAKAVAKEKQKNIY